MLDRAQDGCWRRRKALTYGAWPSAAEGEKEARRQLLGPSWADPGRGEGEGERATGGLGWCAGAGKKATDRNEEGEEEKKNFAFSFPNRFPKALSNRFLIHLNFESRPIITK